MATPTIQDVLAALADLDAALESEAAAHANTVETAQTFQNVLAAFLGTPTGMTAEQVAALKADITAHRDVLKGLAGGSPETRHPVTGDAKMATTLPPDVQAAWDQVGVQTTELGTRIDALSAQIAAGMTDAAAADLRAKFDAESAVLKGYAVTQVPPPPGPAPAPGPVAKKKP